MCLNEVSLSAAVGLLIKLETASSTCCASFNFFFKAFQRSIPLFIGAFGTGLLLMGALMGELPLDRGSMLAAGSKFGGASVLIDGGEEETE